MNIRQEQVLVKRTSRRGRNNEGKPPLIPGQVASVIRVPFPEWHLQLRGILAQIPEAERKSAMDEAIASLQKYL